jgi:ribosomal protein S1
MLGELVITGPRKAGPEFSPADLAVKDMVGSNRESLGGQFFLGIVCEMEDETVFLSITASTNKVRAEDHKRRVLNIQTADLILKLDDVVPLFVHTETLVKEEKDFAVNDRGALVEPPALLIYIDCA